MGPLSNAACVAIVALAFSTTAPHSAAAQQPDVPEAPAAPVEPVRPARPVAPVQGPPVPESYHDASNDFAPWVGMLAPSLSLRFPIDSDEEPDQGLIWSFPIMIEAGNWRHSATLSIAHYLRSGMRKNTLLYRLRLATFRDDRPHVHLFVGAGAFVDNDGYGPEGELAVFVGRLDRVALVISGTYGYDGAMDEHVAQVSLGTWIPYVF
jgi:hypothetical protein